MQKRFGRFVLISASVLLFFSSAALCETLYHEDFSSPGTLEDLGFTAENWLKDDVSQHSIAGAGETIPGLAISSLVKPIPLSRESSVPFGIEWRMNLQSNDLVPPSGSWDLFFHLKDKDALSDPYYEIHLNSDVNAGGPVISWSVGTHLGTLPGASGELYRLVPGFTRAVVRVEFHPAADAGGDGSIRVLMDFGDGTGLSEMFRVYDASISTFTEMGFNYLVEPPTPIFVDDIKVTTGEEPIQTGTVTCQYDALGRLRNASFDDGTAVSDVGFDYDGTGNRTQKMVTQ
jgi:hypothetical protein